jgi:hypothetical protein
MCDLPLDLQRRFEQRWAARFARQTQKETVGLNVGTKGNISHRRVDEKPTLASQGKRKGPAELGQRA